MKRLILMRHGEAAPPQYGDGSDNGRALTERGRQDCTRMALWLKAQAWLPDTILHSSATRTRQTAECLKETLGVDAPLKAESRLYLAPPKILMEAIEDADEQHHTLMLIAHNPGLESFISYFTGQLRPVSPAAIALLESGANDWRLSPQDTRLIDLQQPNQLTT